MLVLLANAALLLTGPQLRDPRNATLIPVHDITCAVSNSGANTKVLGSFFVGGAFTSSKPNDPGEWPQKAKPTLYVTKQDLDITDLKPGNGWVAKAYTIKGLGMPGPNGTEVFFEATVGNDIDGNSLIAFTLPGTSSQGDVETSLVAAPCATRANTFFLMSNGKAYGYKLSADGSNRPTARPANNILPITWMRRTLALQNDAVEFALYANKEDQQWPPPGVAAYSSQSDALNSSWARLDRNNHNLNHKQGGPGKSYVKHDKVTGYFTLIAVWDHTYIGTNEFWQWSGVIRQAP